MKVRVFIDWEEYDRLKTDENMTDRDIARAFGISISTLRCRKKTRGHKNVK